MVEGEDNYMQVMCLLGSRSAHYIHTIQGGRSKIMHGQLGDTVPTSGGDPSGWVECCHVLLK